MKPLTHLAEALFRQEADRHRSPATIKSLRSAVAIFLTYLRQTFQVTTPDRVRKTHLDTFTHHLTTKSNKQGMPLKAASINGNLQGAKKFLTFLYQNGYITQDLAATILYLKTPKLLPTSVLQHIQVKKIIRSIDTTRKEGIRDRTIIELLYSSGIRVGELVRLTLDDVHLDQQIIKVLGKGNKERMVPIGKTARRYLESYIKAIRPFWYGATKYSALFLNRLGKPIDKKSIQAFIPAYAQKAGIEPRVTPHTFRRSCTTELVRAKADLYHVKEILGHESIETLKPYVKLTIHDLQKTHAKCHPREKDQL